MNAEARILYEDNHIIAVEKPVNMPVQKDASLDPDLLSELKEYVRVKYNKPGAAYLGLVHRLDRPVGGTMVFARTSKAAARLSRQFAEHTARKIYLCVVKGEITDALALTDKLLKDEKTGMVRVSDLGKEARLISEPVCSIGGRTLMRVTLLTGRSHQIRVQHANAGYPLVGDARYGEGGGQLALWAMELTIAHPTLNSEMTFTSRPQPVGAWREFDGEY